MAAASTGHSWHCNGTKWCSIASMYSRVGMNPSRKHSTTKKERFCIFQQKKSFCCCATTKGRFIARESAQRARLTFSTLFVNVRRMQPRHRWICSRVVPTVCPIRKGLCRFCCVEEWDGKGGWPALHARLLKHGHQLSQSVLPSAIRFLPDCHLAIFARCNRVVRRLALVHQRKDVRRACSRHGATGKSDELTKGELFFGDAAKCAKKREEKALTIV